MGNPANDDKFKKTTRKIYMINKHLLFISLNKSKAILKWNLKSVLNYDCDHNCNYIAINKNLNKYKKYNYYDMKLWKIIVAGHNSKP